VGAGTIEITKPKSFGCAITLVIFLDESDDSVIEQVASGEQEVGVTPATVNRYLMVVSAVLRKANQWKWIDEMPKIELREEPNPVIGI